MVTRDTPWADGTPCWVDLATSDPAAARDFYAGLMGWEYQIGAPETGNYAVATSDGKSVAGVGGMQTDQPPAWTTYLASAGAAASCDNAVRAGGTLIVPAMDVMGLGRMAIVQDPTSATFGLWQAGTHTGFQLANEAGSVVWDELFTRGVDAAKEFYAAVFSYTFTPMDMGGTTYTMVEVDGSTVGGLMEMPGDVPEQVPSHWRVYFQVADCDATAAKAQELGGSVLRPAVDMPYGRSAELADPQGAMFVVMAQPASQ